MNKPNPKKLPSKRGLLQVKSNTNEWLEARQTLIGGSDIATIFNMNPWMSRQNLWELKTGLIKPLPPTFRMNSGHYMEEGIAQMAFNNINSLASINEDIGIRIHHLHTFLSCTLDRWGLYDRNDGTIGTYVLDCKSSGVSSYKKLKHSKFPSYNYWLQIQQQLLVTQKSIKPDVGFLACWTGGQMLKVWRIQPCLATQRMICDVGQIFQSYVTHKWNLQDEAFSLLDDYQFRIDDYIRQTTSIACCIE
jgi:putative phage-type endonuclease